VTHDQIEAMTLADWIVVLNQGKIEQQGTPLELYRTPANLFVAGFIGSPAMNFIPATLRQRNGATMVEFADGSQVPAPRGLGGEDGRKVIYGVRPEHLALGTAQDGMKTTVAVVEPTGADTQVYARFADVDVNSVFRERHEFASGDQLYLRPDHEHTHLFDAESGQALVRQ
jgi:multiple sugar transport system ATP-binding protein